MSDRSLEALIVDHIDELESALAHANTFITPILGKRTAEIIEEKKSEFGWAGQIADELNDDQWLAPEEWRNASDPDDNFDLYIELGDTYPGVESDTWLGTFCGWQNARLQFSLATNALKPRQWKLLLQSESILVEQLAATGFQCNLKDGDLFLPILIDQKALAEAFEENDFETAFKPFAEQLDLFQKARPILDNLVEAIRRF